jgi:hypothetical protein
MAEDKLEIDLSPREYRVKDRKRREPMINWEHVPAFLGFFGTLFLIKVIYLLAVG